MTKTLEVEIDAVGIVHPVEPATSLPQGRALLVWKTEENEDLLLFSASALQDWLRPEEDEAWAYLQPGKIVSFPFPYSDLSRSKTRPTLLLASVGRGDWIVARSPAIPMQTTKRSSCGKLTSMKADFNR